MTARRLAITTRIDDRGQRVVAVSGAVDLATAAHLAGSLLELTDRDVAVDLSAVTFLDFSGMSALALGYRAVTKAGHSFRTFDEQDHVRRVLEFAGLDKVFHEPPCHPLGDEIAPNWLPSSSRTAAMLRTTTGS